jgi:hypothetical protein
MDCFEKPLEPTREMHRLTWQAFAFDAYFRFARAALDSEIHLSIAHDERLALHARR